MKDTIEEEKRKQRLKQLFAVGRNIGYSKETLQEISSSMGMGEKLSLLSEGQLQRILNSLKKGHPEAFRKPRERDRKRSIPKSQLFSIPSKVQKELTEILLSQVNKIAPYRISLESMAQKTFKIPSEKLSFHEYQSLIEALKSMKSRFERETILRNSSQL
ncbi:hypothetical protein LEP1GSC013_3497 [Leptospira interrogans serovar Valbuzzi str. Duyster]|uniref:hypothetical protein n=1 Tax=Leptospira interrogans TaxID=173 RepID=UPI0002BBE708|nr:hypothetical protein [Leptospira interrogans]EMJ52046.1 hypothetical protein LEP1GSC013_1030 [Leptospira interrogans serovar Valbuzzi str. Duyster]EMJ53666.1 hypothetical protein LEP1GSC013_1769 [Leptospira interrogans serovar Valbuzzi str. Duyster]EMJ54757.1 hypothetical protein LEP1GSC013_2567 [Leptospira interrogans serovar Valbuzzi str. Duyster]EMJ54776.1 hypothetical protein LEP1GSC013_2468 [Leptospira interrogans serovar Valbuzzi str. Duyster]EMJ55404.1 hypothetical protein LEP1GSC013